MIDTRCACCGKLKGSLRRRQSRALPGIRVPTCDDCIRDKWEPRAFLILAARNSLQHGGTGIDAIDYWIHPQRHGGEPISIRELM